MPGPEISCLILSGRFSLCRQTASPSWERPWRAPAYRTSDRRCTVGRAPSIPNPLAARGRSGSVANAVRVPSWGHVSLELIQFPLPCNASSLWAPCSHRYRADGSGLPDSHPRRHRCRGLRNSRPAIRVNDASRQHRQSPSERSAVGPQSFDSTWHDHHRAHRNPSHVGAVTTHDGPGFSGRSTTPVKLGKSQSALHPLSIAI